MSGEDSRVDWLEISVDDCPVPVAPEQIRPRHVRDFRASRRLPVQFTDALHGTMTGVLKDLSSSGARIATNHALGPWTRLSLIAQLPDGDTSPMDGVVRWSRPGSPGQMGIRLDRLDRRLSRLLTMPAARIAPGVFVPLGPPSGPGQAKGPGAPRPPQPRLARYRDELPVRFGLGKVLSKGFTFDLSSRGVGMKAAIIPPPGSDVLVEITLPDGGVARLEGKVAWAKQPERGEALMTGGIIAHCASEAFFQLVLDRQRANSAGMLA